MTATGAHRGTSARCGSFIITAQLPSFWQKSDQFRSEGTVSAPSGAAATAIAARACRGRRGIGKAGRRRQKPDPTMEHHDPARTGRLKKSLPAEAAASAGTEPLSLSRDRSQSLRCRVLRRCHRGRRSDRAAAAPEPSPCGSGPPPGRTRAFPDDVRLHCRGHG